MDNTLVASVLIDEITRFNVKIMAQEEEVRKLLSQTVAAYKNLREMAVKIDAMIEAVEELTGDAPVVSGIVELAGISEDEDYICPSCGFRGRLDQSDMSCPICGRNDLKPFATIIKDEASEFDHVNLGAFLDAIGQQPYTFIAALTQFERSK